MDDGLEKKLFLPRPGEDTGKYVETLTAPPEYVLDEAAKNRVMAFESDLFEGKALDRSADIILPDGERPSIKDLLKLVAKAHHVPTDYFLSDEGRTAAEEAELSDIASVNDGVELTQLLTLYSFEKPDQLKQQLLGKAEKWIRNRATDAIIGGEPIQQHDEACFLLNPHDFAIKIRGLLSYASFFRGVRRDLKARGDSPENLAKQAVVEIYQARVNASLAEEYPALLEFTSQVRQLPSEYDAQWQEWLGSGFSTRLRLLINEREMGLRFARRLDALRNGLAEGYGHNSPYRGVSRVLQQYFDKEAEKDLDMEPMFNRDEVAVLSEIEVDTPTMQSWLEAVLKERGLLSEHAYDIEKDRLRKGRAPDAKWQIAIDPTTSSLAVDKIKGIIKLSGDFSRSLTSVEPVGAIAVAAHELEHVEQSELSYRNNCSLRLTREITGKRATLLREASGIKREREVHATLFGQHRPDNPHYMHALTTFELTGDETAATKAFIRSVLNGRQLEELSEKQRRSTVYKAVDRVRRLTHRYGGFNSQPMVYAEQAVLAEETSKLPAEVQQLIFAEASLDLPDMARLHRFGLLAIGEQTDKSLPDIFIEQAMPFMKTKIEELQHGKK